MKKVIAVLSTIVVLILGTAVGVAVSASHLSEKGLLTASDVQLALASQGIFTHAAAGDYSELTVDGVTPVVYKVGERELLVYVFDDALKRDQAKMPFDYGTSMTQWFNDIGCWRNLAIYGRLTIGPEKLMGEMMTAQGRARYIAESEQHRKFQQTLLHIFNDVQTKTFQIETDEMIYTVEQDFYAMPTPIGSRIWHDNWLHCRLAGCQYKEQPPAEELPIIISLGLENRFWSHRSTLSDIYWDGQGIMTENLLQGSAMSLTLRPDTATGTIIFQRGSLKDEAVFAIDLGESV